MIRDDFHRKAMRISYYSNHGKYFKCNNEPKSLSWQLMRVQLQAIAVIKNSKFFLFESAINKFSNKRKRRHVTGLWEMQFKLWRSGKGSYSYPHRRVPMRQKFQEYVRT